MTPIGAEAFSALMAPLGPFESAPRLAAGVSGGADSLCLALLADAWARARGGSLLALIVDHGLRPESAAEALATQTRLAGCAIPSRILTLADLEHGPALAERARAARYRALASACAAEGILHLLLGHHAADQAETVLIRALGGSAAAGMAGMAALAETGTLRLLRPLLPVPPGRLRTTLRAAGIGWVEDPSNSDPRPLRSRIRLLRADRDGTGAATAGLARAAAASGSARAVREEAAAAFLAARVTLRPEGFALLADGPVPADVFAALARAIAGRSYAPASAQVAQLAAMPRPATLAGVRLLPAGRLGPGLLMVREAAAMAAPVPAAPGAIWDGRFRLVPGTAPEAIAGMTLGALGADAARLRRCSPLPAAVLRTLPALRLGDTLVTVPHLAYRDVSAIVSVEFVFDPPRPVAGAAFATGQGCAAGGGYLY
jgi:tRNA(Ile)-lysidine synthase